jgi:Protein of unknown function (DUF2510)/Septum formation
MSEGPSPPPAGWYPDPSGAPVQRYWDGTAWTAGEAPMATSPQQSPRNGLGIAALVLGIIGVVVGIIPFFFWLAVILGVIGLIFGFIGRGRANRGEATNGTMALWGIITSAVAVVLSIVGLVILVGAFEEVEEDLSTSTEPSAAATSDPALETSTPAQEEGSTPAESGDVGVFDLEVGDCLGEETGEGEIESIEAAPCSEPHTEEIFAALTVPDGDYPGQEALDAEAEGCLEEFAEFVGMPYEESVLEINYMTPTEESWGMGDRELLCTVYDPAGDTTGTLADANR